MFDDKTKCESFPAFFSMPFGRPSDPNSNEVYEPPTIFACGEPGNAEERAQLFPSLQDGIQIKFLHYPDFSSVVERKATTKRYTFMNILCLHSPASRSIS
jgi:hypothetical protein